MVRYAGFSIPLSLSHLSAINAQRACFCKNVFYEKERILDMLHPIFNVPIPASRSQLHDQYPCSLGGKTSDLGVNLQAISLRHRKNNLYIYLVYTYNVFY